MPSTTLRAPANSLVDNIQVHTGPVGPVIEVVQDGFNGQINDLNTAIDAAQRGLDAAIDYIPEVPDLLNLSSIPSFGIG